MNLDAVEPPAGLAERLAEEARKSITESPQGPELRNAVPAPWRIIRSALPYRHRPSLPREDPPRTKRSAQALARIGK